MDGGPAGWAVVAPAWIVDDRYVVRGGPEGAFGEGIQGLVKAFVSCGPAGWKVLSLRKEVDLLGELGAGYGVASVGLFSVRRWLVWLVVSLPVVVALVWVAERFGWVTKVPLMTGVLFGALAWWG
jgi:hypothetical protein